MDQEHDAGPHLSHAEVEHGADVDDEEEGADDRQGEHWKSWRWKQEWKRHENKDDDAEQKQDKDENLKSLLDNSPRLERRKPPRWSPASSLRPLWSPSLQNGDGHQIDRSFDFK